MSTGVTPKHVDELRTIALAAAELVDDLDGQRAREAAAFEEGYRLAFEAGREIGYRQAEDDMQRAWSALAAKVRSWADRPRFRELEKRRYPDRSHRELQVMRGRDRYPLPDRQCHVCGGRIPGGVE